VEDYLQYRGVDWKNRGTSGPVSAEAVRTEGAAKHGTADNRDGHGAGCISVQ